MSYTIGDIINSMKNVVEKHLIDKKDKQALLELNETSWIQLGFAAMLATCDKDVQSAIDTALAEEKNDDTSDPSRKDDKYTLPDVKVFYINEKERAIHKSYNNDPGEPGWYYWYCFPGCLPDSDPIGPYDTEQKAIDAARDKAVF